jgi:hypothetical protein
MKLRRSSGSGRAMIGIKEWDQRMGSKNGIKEWDQESGSRRQAGLSVNG